jgi:P27 family predicted phage terminase small subunit
MGTHRPDRKPSEVQPTKGIPPIPAWASKAARKHWHQISPWLNEVGLLTRLDQTALALLCEALGDFLCARDIVDEEAKPEGSVRFITTTDKGNVIQHPAVGVMNKAHERLMKLLREFGMTPSSRAGLAIAGREVEDPMTDLFRQIAAKRGNN